MIKRMCSICNYLRYHNQYETRIFGLTKFSCQAIEKELGVSSKELREKEFKVFVSLEFSLHIAREDYMPHLERLISQLDYNSLQDYLDGKPPSDRPLIFIE